MQKVPLETQVNFALPIFQSMNIDISFDDILYQVEQKIQKFGGNFKQSEIILLMKYIGYYELLNNNPVPEFFSQNSKKPISSEKGALIEKLIANFDPNASFTIEKSVSVEKNVEEALTETENQSNEDDGLEFNPLLLKKVDELELSVRSANCLKNDNIVYVGDLVQNTEATMLRIPNFGRSSLYEIKKVLSQLDLYFGMNIEDWPPDNVEELAKKHQNSSKLQNENTGISQKIRSVNVEDISDEKLAVIFSEITSVDFSVRLRNVLSNLQIEAVGQILLGENLSALGITADAKLANYGKSSEAELKEFLEQQGLYNFSLSEWPPQNQIETLIQNRNLVVGRCFAKIANSETIEGEARDIFAGIASDAHKEGIFKRFGIEGECIPWTLQEVADEGFENGIKITRERVRQIQEKYLKNLKDIYINSTKCTEVAGYIRGFSFISESLLNDYLEERNLTKASDPISLLKRLRDYGFCNFSHKVIEVGILNSRFLVKEEYEEEFIKFTDNLRKKLVGVVFANLNSTLAEAIKEEDYEEFFECFKENMDHFKNIVVCEQEEEIYIAKRAFRLGARGINRDGARTNSLVSVLTKIFSICSSVNLRVLHQAVSRDRTVVGEEISLDFLKKYLEACPFIKFEGERVICVQRPRFDGKIMNEYKILDLAIEKKSAILTSTQLVKGLVQRGLSENAASVLRNTSPFLISLKRGHFRTKGIFRLICDVKDLDIINYREEESSSNQPLSSEQKFKISNNPPLRATGRATVPKLEIDEGEYQVYDDEDNYLVDVKVRGKMILGLKNLAVKNPDSELNLSFSEGRFVLS